MISTRLNIDNKKYELIVDNDEQCRFFKEMNTYIPKLLFYLWVQPKTVSEILALGDKSLVKEHLAPLIVNNFYENVISSNYIEDNLMYVIALLLKREINELNNEEDSEIFLEETACGFVLEQLRAKNDIKYFFKNIISSVLKKMEVDYSGSDINLNVKQIQEKYQKTKEELDKLYKKTGKKKKIIDNEFYRKIIISNVFSYQEEDNESGFLIPKDNIDPKLFNSKYIPDVTKSELESKKQSFENDKNMMDYCDYNIKKGEKDDSYANQKLLQNIFDSPISKEVLASYQIEFSKIINLINKLIQNLLNDLYLLPYSVKCICKIIFLLINKKFNNISEVQKNAFIAKFFFNKLFAPIFENPGLGASIDDLIISETTKHNATIINLVLKKLVSGRLFQTEIDSDSDYTPLNWFFLDQMPEVLKFFDNITKVALPNFIEKLINDELPNNFELDYFSENKEEVIYHRSVCFTLFDLDALLLSIDKSKEILFKDENEIKGLKPLRLTFEKLTGENCSKLMKKLKEKKEFEIIKEEVKNKKKDKVEYKEVEGRELLKYFLITDLITNKQYTKLFEIEQEKASFSIKELKKTETPEEVNKNNIIKVKNFFANLLYNYRTLVKTDFDQGTISDTNSILNEIKKFIKSSDFVIDGSIPSEWYASSLVEYLKKLPEELSKNDFEELYKELSKDINNSIKELDFEALSVCLGKVKFAKRVKINYEQTYKHILNIDLNEKVQKIIENEFIPVEIHYKYNKKEKEFSIEEKNNIKENSLDLLDNALFEEGSEKKNICKTIKLFTKRFPDLTKEQIKYDKNLTEMNKEIKLNENLLKYFEIIKKRIEKGQKNLDENELKDINDKIYDYVMEKIYEKIYPKEPDPEDSIIFKKCVLLSWVEPKHFLAKKQNYIFDSFLPDVIEFFGKLNSEKSPRIKFLYMKKIFLAINDVLRFNGRDGQAGVDDQMPILNYSFIKARPQNISANCKFMNLFIGKNRNRSEGSQLTQILGICEHIINLTYNQLNGVTKEEFDDKCNKAQFEQI